MPGWISPWELFLLLIVALLFFGPKRLPEMGKSLGKGMREFKNSISGKDEDEQPQPIEVRATAEEQPAPAVRRERDTVG